MRVERLNNLPLNTVTPNFAAIFMFFDTASLFIERISFSEIEAKREAILFLFGCSEVNSTWIITSELANQRAPKALFTCVVYTNGSYHGLREQIRKLENHYHELKFTNGSYHGLREQIRKLENHYHEVKIY